jgi:hypothetical protein
MAVFEYRACLSAGCFLRIFISLLPHILCGRMLLVELPLESHLVELLLQSVYPAGLNGGGELVFLRLVGAEAVESTG